MIESYIFFDVFLKLYDVRSLRHKNKLVKPVVVFDNLPTMVYFARTIGDNNFFSSFSPKKEIPYLISKSMAKRCLFSSIVTV